MVPAAVETDHRNREERLEGLFHADGAGPGTPASVGRRERLVEIEMDDVEVHLPGGRAAQDRVEVRAVVVEEAAGIVDDLSNLEHVLLEDPEGVRVREHERERLIARGRLERL